jgi:hypothetical protein
LTLSTINIRFSILPYITNFILRLNKELIKRQKSGNSEGPMERYLDIRTKQFGDEVAQLAREKRLYNKATFFDQEVHTY